MTDRPSPALVRATFVERPNRFIVRARLGSGAIVEAHLADPGRLRELLRPGAQLRLRPAAGPEKRRTRFSVALVRAAAPPCAWVGVETTRANALAGELLERGAVRGIARGRALRREVPDGRSRFDFVVERRGGGKTWVEVKSVTLVEGDCGLFPDAPTERGRRHVAELTRLVRDGERAAILFVAQREDARRVRPHAGIDPALAAALVEARSAGVLLRAARFRLDADGGAEFLGAVPVLRAAAEVSTRG